MQSGNLLVVTGKTFGITNIIALDADRNVIQDQRVLVKRDEVKVVNLQRGTQRQSYNCTPQCNPSITVGDEQAYFDTIRRPRRTRSASPSAPPTARSRAASRIRAPGDPQMRVSLRRAPASPPMATPSRSAVPMV